jgi:hypothetical protein
VQTEIATVRVEITLAALARLARHHSRVEQSKSRRESLKQFSQLTRARSSLQNVVELVRDGIDLPRDQSARLVARCWKGLATAEQEMSQTLACFAELQHAHSQCSTEEEKQFEEERVALLRDQAAQLAASAQDRLVHRRHRSRRDI